MRHLVFSALVLTACHPVDTPEPTDETNPQGLPPGSAGTGASTDKKGSRLKRMVSVLTAEDGTQVTSEANSYFDSKLNEPCYFRQAEDGRNHCLPISLAAVQTQYFLDVFCSQKLIVIYTCTAGNSIPKYALETQPKTNTTSCDYTVPAVQKAYGVGSPFNPSTLYSNMTGTCKALTATEFSSFTKDAWLFTVGNYVPPTEFVAGENQLKVLP